MGWLNDKTEKEYNKVLEYFEKQEGNKHTRSAAILSSGVLSGSVSDHHSYRTICTMTTTTE